MFLLLTAYSLEMPKRKLPEKQQQREEEWLERNAK